MIIIVMGVSGSGKTTIGKLLSKKLELPFYDADDFHPKENVEKMAQGLPLNDSDRWPWLASMAQQIPIWANQGGAVLSCSALKESYRQKLSENHEAIYWVHLTGNRAILEERMHQRQGHFMKAQMLTSQLKTLEIPEYAIQVDIDSTPNSIIDQILLKIKPNA